jgi:hypothetical protein
MVGKTASMSFGPPRTHVDYLGTLSGTMIPVDEDRMPETWYDLKAKLQYVTSLVYQDFKVIWIEYG